MEFAIPKNQPVVISRSEHCLSRANISANALKVLYRLRGAGFQACLVGGGVRDLLLGREPKDFDVGTNAHPEEVRKLFRNCRLIGRRFRLAHVRFGKEIIEVATFRGSQVVDQDSDRTEDLNDHLSDNNVYGSIEEDAWRRDFTINALYYDINTFVVLDYVGAMDDLQGGLIRLIGEPEQRYREDPVRMLRAVRFAAKLGFRMHPDTEVLIPRMGYLLEIVPAARLFDEVLKLLLGGHALQTFELLRHYDLFGHLFPLTERCLHSEEALFPRMFLIRALANTDARVIQGKPVTPAFLFAALLWEPLRERVTRLHAAGASEQDAIAAAADEVVRSQVQRIALPRRFSIPMREIWSMQPRFEQRTGKRSLRLLAHPRFRAAYDFLLLRAEAGEPIAELADWWTHFLSLDEAERQKLVQSKPGKGSRSRRRRGTSKDVDSKKSE